MEGMTKVRLLADGPFQYSGPHLEREFLGNHRITGEPQWGQPLADANGNAKIYDRGVYKEGDVFLMGLDAVEHFVKEGTIEVVTDDEPLTYPPPAEE